MILSGLRATAEHRRGGLGLTNGREFGTSTSYRTYLESEAIPFLPDHPEISRIEERPC